MSGMWDVAAFRLRRYAHFKRQRRKQMEAAEAATRREFRKQLSLRKVAAQLRLSEVGEQGAEHLAAQVILNDVTHGGLKLYSESPIAAGTEISVTIESPRPLFVRARVTFCYEFTQSGRILRGHNYPYRVGLEFVFDSDIERTHMAGFCRELRDRHLTRR